MVTFEMLDNIRAHSIQVARVSLALLDGLAANGQAQNLPEREVVVAGALLHDIAKTKCIQEGCRHADIGQHICEGLGYPVIADIVQQHVILNSFQRSNYIQGIFSAAELVYYADKRVRHDQVVSLEERLEYIIERYGRKDPEIISKITHNFDACLKIEKYIFSFLSFPVNQLGQHSAHIQLASDTAASTD